MKALKTKGIAHEGILSVRVPKEFNEQELEVIVLTKNKNELNEESEVKKFHEIPSSERLKILERYKGSAKYPDFPITKYDVYDQ